MFRRSFVIRNFVKEKVCQLYDTWNYAHGHPYSTLHRRYHEQTVDFIESVCPRAVAVRTPRKLLDLALARIPPEGQVAEFGVFKGASLRYIARRLPNRAVHGFDSFEGLPEPWVSYDRGAFSTNSRLPRVPKNVRLWPGWFEDTMPEWRKEYGNTPLAFVHIDCDLRSSTETVLKYIEDMVRPGTVIVFDDYFNFPHWQEDGHAAFEAFVERGGWSVTYIGYAFKEIAVVINK